MLNWERKVRAPQDRIPPNRRSRLYDMESATENIPPNLLGKGEKEV